MEKIIKVLDFIISLVTTWKLIFPIILVIIARIGNLFDLAKKIVQVSLPLWIVIIIFLLAIYPIANLLVYVIKRNTQKLTELYGLLWKKPLFPFGYPKPYCPREKCGKEVIYRIKPPKSIQLMSSRNDWENAETSIHHWYECPIHGRLPNVPDEELFILQKKAKLALKKL
ncbi:MAG: hypothetical protein ACP5D6_10575 [Kosmotogaceae bacterium]